MWPAIVQPDRVRMFQFSFPTPFSTARRAHCCHPGLNSRSLPEIQPVQSHFGISHRRETQSQSELKSWAIVIASLRDQDQKMRCSRRYVSIEKKLDESPRFANNCQTPHALNLPNPFESPAPSSFSCPSPSPFASP